MSALQTVHVRVNDAATGQPTPVRIQFLDAEGKYYAPLGRLTEFATDPGQDVGGNLCLGGERFAYIDGSCEIRLPPGPISLQVHKGFEYKPLHQQITLTPGKLTLRLDIERWSELKREGWCSGDTLVQYISPHAALLEGAAEDVAFVNLVARHLYALDPNPVRPNDLRTGFPTITNILAFSGQRPLLELPGHMVVVNTENHHAQLGTLALLNCHRVVYPLLTDLRRDSSEWTLGDWCDQCHRKGGLVIGTRLFSRYSLPVDPELLAHYGKSPPIGEGLAELVLGKIDVLDVRQMLQPGPWAFRPDYWYQLLNAGIRVPAVAGSDKRSNATVIGSPRTYARLLQGQEFNYKNWIEAVRAGRTFVTSGPLLAFTVNGQEIGSDVQVTSGERWRLSANARSIRPFERLEILLNGAVIESHAATGSPTAATIETEIEISEGGWMAARCIGVGSTGQSVTLAHTSPIYVRIGDRKPPINPDSVALLIRQLDAMVTWLKWQGSEGGLKIPAALDEVFRLARQGLSNRR